MTLFIGIVATSMEEAKQAGRLAAIAERRFELNRHVLELDHDKVDIYKSIFDSLDMKHEKKLDREDLKSLVRSLPLVRVDYRNRNGDGVSERDSLSRKDVDNLIVIIDDDHSG
jgi:hypothetical protein